MLLKSGDMDNNKVTRIKYAKRNIYVSLICQVFTMICGLITPRCMLNAFGSEVNGALTSIATFLGYITLLEGGIGGVARAALYRPLAENDINKLSAIVSEMRSFFRKLGSVYIVYVFIIAVSFKYIAHLEILDWSVTFWLVIIISISTFVQYFIGLSNKVLLVAAQKQYLVNIIDICGTIGNTIFVVALTYLGCSLLVVKLFSSLIFTLKPICFWAIVKKNFNLSQIKTNGNELNNKWTGLGQHIAFFLHTHTDVVVLTLFGNLMAVSVYSVYNMVTSAVQSISSSFSTGMESVFGDMYARSEMKTLMKTFSTYETLVSIISTFLFSTTIVLISPFILIYTSNVNDTNYYEPIFGILLCTACLLFCLRTPYHNMVIAAGHFKQTNAASYGESIINIVSSVVLVIRFGLIGVAIGTVVAMSYRFIYYAVYLSKKIIKRPFVLWIKRELINFMVALSISFIGERVIHNMIISTYIQWVRAAVLISIIAGIITFMYNIIFYQDECISIWRHLKKNNK